MTARLFAGGAVFIAAYYALFAAGLPQWTADAALILPAGVAAVLLALRARREEGRTAWFFALLALGAATWLLADGFWVAAELVGHTPYSPVRELRGFPIVFDALFLGFLVPILGALTLRPHGHGRRAQPLSVVDAGLVSVALTYVFLRLAFLPLLARPSNWRALQGTLWFVLAVWAGALWRLQPEARWRRRYGAIALFALTYPSLSNIAQGLGRALPPGGPADLAWVLPFLFLAAAALDPVPARDDGREWAPIVLLLCGAGPMVFDNVLSLALPAAGLDFSQQPVLLLAVTALLGVGCAMRFRVEATARDVEGQQGRSRAEEERRAARLTELARVALPLLPRIEAAVEDVWRRTTAAVAVLGDKAERALEQAGRARELVARLGAALRPADHDREDVELVPLLEACVHGALERGPALNVRLDGLGVLPPVRGSRQALAGCFVQLIRNAAQASPGGALHVTGDVEDGMVVLRFTDDGPGIPRELRHRIFEPFFTTRRVGEGYGLGLTEVHFVARDHGGTVLLEPSEPGTCLAVRLPMARPAVPDARPQDWPMPAAVVAAAAFSLVLVVLPSAAARLFWSVSLQVAAGTLAAGAMAWTAARHKGRARRFWAALAAGPAIWSITRILRVMEGGLGGAERGSVWHYGSYALAELAWVVALLVRPDRPRERVRSAPWALGVAAAFCLSTYLYSYLVMLPAPFAVWDAALREQTAVWRGVLRLCLAAWALALAWRAATPYWRSLFGRLGMLIALWGLGQTLAGVFRSRSVYNGGAITDLGWIVPLLLLAGFALTEGLRAPRRESMPAPMGAPRPLWTAAELASLAALPAFDALMGPSAHPDLDLARRGMTWSAVVVVGALLAAREYFTHREPTARRRPRLSSASSGMEPERLLKVVSTAVYEMAGHLSGITALARLVLTQSDASGRVRGDSERIQTRADMAARIARNLIALLQGGTATPELASVNRLVDEVVQLRGADLEHEGIRLARSLDPQLPAVWWVHAPAVRQALLCCLDAAAVALRADGRRGTIEIATSQEGDELVVRLHADGPGLPRSVLAPLSSGRFDSRQDPDLGLSLGREILLQYGGTLSGRHRPQGGAELVIRLPMIAMPAAPETRWLGLGAGAPRSH